MIIVMFGVLASVQRSVSLQTRLDQNNDQARLAMEQLDKEVRSGNVLYIRPRSRPRIRYFASTRKPMRQAGPPTRILLRAMADHIRWPSADSLLASQRSGFRDRWRTVAS